jgi:hypothetical protein
MDPIIHVTHRRTSVVVVDHETIAFVVAGDESKTVACAVCAHAIAFKIHLPLERKSKTMCAKRW